MSIWSSLKNTSLSNDRVCKVSGESLIILLIPITIMFLWRDNTQIMTRGHFTWGSRFFTSAWTQHFSSILLWSRRTDVTPHLWTLTTCDETMTRLIIHLCSECKVQDLCTLKKQTNEREKAVVLPFFIISAWSSEWIGNNSNDLGMNFVDSSK